MKSNKSVVAIIPARGGSKAVPKKNIHPLGGFPLLAYSIIAAKLAKNIDRVIVSTDSEEIAEIAKKYGAEVPFMRPTEFATDKAIDKDYLLHALRWFKDNERFCPQYLVNLRPTTPLRDPQHIDEAITLIKSKPVATSLRSGHEIKESPYKLLGLENDFFRGLFPHDPRPEYYDLTRQSFPPVYQPDGYVDIIVSDFALSGEQLHGPNILAYLSPDTGEVDRLEDFKFIEFKLEKEPWAVYQHLKENFGTPPQTP